MRSTTILAFARPKPQPNRLLAGLALLQHVRTSHELHAEVLRLREEAGKRELKGKPGRLLDWRLL